MNRKDLQALTLVGPTRDNPELDPLAILHLYNQLYILIYANLSFFEIPPTLTSSFALWWANFFAKQNKNLNQKCC